LHDDAAARALLRLVKDEKSGQTHVRLPAHER
jgi:hypothetical protein